jgi:drug/metabolite transporter (DMT)-like permease
MERYATRYDTVAFTLVQMVAAAAAVTPTAAATGTFPLPHSSAVVWALIVTGVFSSALGFLAQNWAQRRVNATQTALSLSLEPVWTAIFGVGLAGDQLSTNALLGSAMIMGGLIISEPGSTALLRQLMPITASRGSQPATRGLAIGENNHQPRRPSGFRVAACSNTPQGGG